ncbi:hypothetical protein [Kitasatospora sp. NPDC093806]|uniref:hypothetical protein n=1 Tax=Kitasatospora sp. NPDC093806 TaxID=3155075 RepID=UPI00342F3F0C
MLIVSPMVMTELDHLLARRAGEAEAVNAIARLGALAGQGFVVLPPADRRMYADAEQLLRQYQGHERGLADAVNAVLAWRLQRPAIAATATSSRRRRGRGSRGSRSTRAADGHDRRLARFRGGQRTQDGGAGVRRRRRSLRADGMPTILGDWVSLPL